MQQTIEAQRVELVLYKTCLDYFHLTHQVAVGIVGGMPDIIEAMQKAVKRWLSFVGQSSLRVISKFRIFLYNQYRFHDIILGLYLPEAASTAACSTI